MYPELLGLFAALGFAASHTLAKGALRTSNAFTGAAISTAVNCLFLWPLSFILVPGESIFIKGLWAFVLDGALNPGLSRWLLYTGIFYIGVSRSGSIAGSAPLFSLIVALTLLGENVTMPVLTGTAAVVLGIVLLSQRKEEASFSLWGVFIALLAAILFGLSPPIRRWGFDMGAHPLPGAALASTVSLALLLLLSPSFGSGSKLVLNRRALILFGLGGVANCLAVIAYFYALSISQVVIVVPLANAYPLFNIGTAFFVWKEGEYLSWKVVAGGFLIMLGAWAIIAR